MHANLLSSMPGNVTAGGSGLQKSLEGIAWESDWQLSAVGLVQESDAGEAVNVPGS